MIFKVSTNVIQLKKSYILDDAHTILVDHKKEIVHIANS